MAVPWAASLISERKREEAFRVGHVKAAVAAAAQASAVLAGLSSQLSVARRWRYQMAVCDGLTDPSTGLLPNVGAGVLLRHRRQLLALGLRWNIASSGVAGPNLLADEFAVGLLAVGCNPADLFEQIGQALVSRESPVPAIVRVLTEARPYAALIAVDGAKRMDLPPSSGDLSALRQVLPGEKRQFKGWGDAGTVAAQISTMLSEQPYGRHAHRYRCIFTGQTLAIDARSAALTMQRETSELLDGFVAAHPYRRLVADDLVCVGQPNSKVVQVIRLGPPGEVSVDALAGKVAPAVRSTIRITSLLRASASPMTQVALSWVGLETAGIRPGDAQLVAKSLALLALRQRVFLPYRLLAQDALDSHKRRKLRRQVQVRRAKAERLAGIILRPGVPPDRAQALERDASLLAIAASIGDVLLDKMARHDARNKAHLASLADELNPLRLVRGEAFLCSLASWCGLLRSSWETDRTIAATDFRFLLDNGDEYVKANCMQLIDAVRDPLILSRELQECKSWLQYLISSSYAARNIHLHTGGFRSAGDVVFALSGVRLLDGLLEVVNPWFADGTVALDGSIRTDILPHLASRFDRVSAYLDAGGSPVNVDFDALTLPTWTPDPGV